MTEMTDVIYKVLQMRGMTALKDPKLLCACISDLAPLELDQKAKMLNKNLTVQICLLLYQGAVGDQNKLRENIGKTELILQNDHGMSKENARWMAASFYNAICKNKGYSDPKTSSQLKEIAVGINLACSNFEVAYYNEEKKSVFWINYEYQQEKWKIDLEHDRESFSAVLKSMKSDLEKKGIGRIKNAVFALPASFSYLQKKTLVQTAESLGIHFVSMDTAGIFASMSKIVLNLSDRAATWMDIVCNFQDKYFEISAIGVDGDGVYESYGTTEIRCENGWNTISQADFQKRIGSEIQQFFKDIGVPDSKKSFFFGTDCTYEYRVFMIGNRNKYIEDLLREKTGKTIEKDKLIVSMGALMHCLQVLGVKTYSNYDYLRLATYDRNIWVGLGNYGEKDIVIYRYTTIPAKASVKLLLSTETHLRVYEGNFFNPKFDCLLADIPLDSVKAVEGKEIECEADIDPRGKITVNVYNHEKKKLLSQTL